MDEVIKRTAHYGIFTVNCLFMIRTRLYSQFLSSFFQLRVRDYILPRVTIPFDWVVYNLCKTTISVTLALLLFMMAKIIISYAISVTLLLKNIETNDDNETLSDNVEQLLVIQSFF